MEVCTDFTNEKTQLEYVCGCLGVKVVITTKYHAEYAGEGIEYSWGAAKSDISTLSIIFQKRKRELFRPCVKMYLTRGAHDRLDSQVQPESKKLHVDV